MTASQVDVLVVGAGPTGLTLAYELARGGHRVSVVDKAAAPASNSRALVVHCRTQELLEKSGLRDQFEARAIPIRGMRFHRAGRVLATIPFDLGRFPALSLPQQETEAVLRSALSARGVDVQWGREVTAIRQEANGVEAVASGLPICARYVVGCDGAHSSVRKLLNIPFEGEALVETLWMTDANLEWDLSPDHVWQLVHPSGALSAIPMPGCIWRLVAMPAHDDNEPDAGFFEDAIKLRTGVTPRRLDVRWVSTFRVNCRLAAVYGSGNVLLAGDAAHIHSPIGGQGMNVGMLDAFSLAEHLARALASADADPRRGYEAERRPHAHAVIRANARITKLAQARNPVQRIVRDHVIPRVLSLAPVARRAGLQASGIA